MIALTSLSPDPGRFDVQTECIESWRNAGLTPVSLNCQSEIDAMRGQYSVEFAKCESTAQSIYGKPLVTINALLDWVERSGETALLVNGDLEIAMYPAEMKTLATTARAGLGYLLQMNHDGDRRKGTPEPCGLSAFLVRPAHSKLCAPSSRMCFGQPWWDYWLPYVALKDGQHLYTPHLPTAFHERHAGRWDAAAWDDCAVELGRLTGLDAGSDRAGHSRLSAQVHAEIRAHTTLVQVIP